MLPLKVRHGHPEEESPNPTGYIANSSARSMRETHAVRVHGGNPHRRRIDDVRTATINIYPTPGYSIVRSENSNIAP